MYPKISRILYICMQNIIIIYYYFFLKKNMIRFFNILVVKMIIPEVQGNQYLIGYSLLNIFFSNLPLHWIIYLAFFGTRDATGVEKRGLQRGVGVAGGGLLRQCQPNQSALFTIVFSFQFAVHVCCFECRRVCFVICMGDRKLVCFVCAVFLALFARKIAEFPRIARTLCNLLFAKS